MSSLRLIPLDDAVVFPGMNITLTAAVGDDERVVLENVPGCSAAFSKLEDRIDPSKVRSAPMPYGTARKIPIRYLVNLATKMLEADPRVFICDEVGCASCAAKREAVGSTSTSAVG